MKELGYDKDNIPDAGFSLEHPLTVPGFTAELLARVATGSKDRTVIEHNGRRFEIDSIERTIIIHCSKNLTDELQENSEGALEKYHELQLAVVELAIEISEALKYSVKFGETYMEARLLMEKLRLGM